MIVGRLSSYLREQSENEKWSKSSSIHAKVCMFAAVVSVAFVCQNRSHAGETRTAVRYLTELY